MSFSRSIWSYRYLFSNKATLGLLAGFSPLKISWTYILATLFGVPLRLSSVRSRPSVSIMALKCFSMMAIFSSSLLSKASGRKGVSVLVKACSSPISSSLKCARLICSPLSRVFNEIPFCFIKS